ncbi:MAG TPA: hypothetical protein V6D08_21360 [Candidatus Obscuribacterales bacterium]
MTEGKARAKPTAAERAAKTQAAARERVVSRGIVQFRADRELMDLLLKVAEYKRIPYGVLARSWVVEALREEARRLGIE